MLRHHPLMGDFPITQSFGDNPDDYAHYSCAGVPLLGHTGIDFAAPEGTPVLAVQDGAVLTVGNDPAGFGLHLLLGHEWGQSLYAHLAQVDVSQGQSVMAGAPLGRSGNTGNSTGPHLHFGVRIAPFRLDDGWCGYADPMPILRRHIEPRGAIMGPHIIGGIEPHLETLAAWQPRLILLLDPNPEEVARLRAVCPNTVLVGRLYVPDNEMAARIRTNPAEAAAWAHDFTMTRISGDIDYWQIANEILQSADDLPLLNRFETARMALAEEAGYRCAILAFSVGNPDLPGDDPMALWRLVYPALARAEAAGHVVALHQYGMPDLWGPDGLRDWLIYRLEHQILPALPFKKLQFAVTEYGIDGLIQGSGVGGWQDFTDAQGYVDQLLRSGRYVEFFSGRILGYAVFTLGHNAPWGSYDIAGPVAEQLAQRSQRGTWLEVDTGGSGLQPETGDNDIAQPGHGGTDRPVDFEPRISPWIEHFNMQARGLDERPDQPEGEIVYLIKDVFTTRSGSWEPSDEPGSIPQWARDAYLTTSFLEAGADHHLFAAVIGLDGELVRDHQIRFWSDGFERLGDAGYNAYIRERTKQDSGWANLFMVQSSVYAPGDGEAGPWCWAPDGAAEVMCGGGLPDGQPISTFVVWQAFRRADLEPEEPGDEEENGGTPDEGTPDESEPENGNGEAPVERRLSEWVDDLNLAIRTLDERPDPLPDEDVVYLIKDVFTTLLGSWEPSDEFGSVPQWARDAYLKPFGAPDYFDDAGADHHLFAAVIGLDGELIRGKEIFFWSDGFDRLADPAFTGYVYRTTKERSGWINIPIGPGSSYVPERGEMGPWCWAPTGAAEVICGGGLPANHHISTFVVWQAVPRSVLEETDGFTTLLPLVMGTPHPVRRATALTRTAPETGLLRLRAAAWLRMGVEADPESPLAEYARSRQLGRPVTQQFVDEGFVVQGFAGGIVFAPVARPRQVAHLAW